jgi:selenide,water dikinase
LSVIGKILDGGQSVCRAAGIPIAGGHTIDSVEPIYGLVALGLAHPDHIKRNSDAQVGDILILGKPIGVGIMSAALKKEMLSDEGYQAMISNTTKLNTAGPDLAKLQGVHALTDITGFGLAGHLLEMARGAHCTVRLNWSQVPLLPGVKALADQGCITGASGRNWQGYGSEVSLPSKFSSVDQNLLTDPQTSGGLLVSCSPGSVDDVLAIFKQHGFNHASVVGHVEAKQSHGLVIDHRAQV